MKRWLQLGSLCLCIGLLVGCSSGSKSITGNGQLKTESRQVSQFDSIRVHGAFKISVVQAADQMLSVSADSNILPKIITKVEDHVLNVSVKGHDKIIESHIPTLQIKVAKLSEIAANGASHIQAENIKTDDLEVETSGASKINLSGVSDELHIKSAGAVQVNARDLRANDVKVKLSGAGKVMVYPIKKLNVKIAGVGEVGYVGQPHEIKQKVAGVGKVMRLMPQAAQNNQTKPVTALEAITNQAKAATSSQEKSVTGSAEADNKATHKVTP